MFIDITAELLFKRKIALCHNSNFLGATRNPRVRMAR